MYDEQYWVDFDETSQRWAIHDQMARVLASYSTEQEAIDACEVLNKTCT